jgi:hypothetical protein
VRRRSFLLGILGAAGERLSRFLPWVPKPASLPGEFYDAISAFPVSDVFTLEQLLAAEALLRRQNVPPFWDGHYRCFVHPDTAEDLRIYELSHGHTHRVSETAIAILAHERRRVALGLRSSRPTADEAFDRAVKLG